MSQQFDFSLAESLAQNLERLRVHLEAIDPDCTKLLFANLRTLQSGDSDARRDFNRKIFEALMEAAQDEINGSEF
jgi:hypothetical protein